MNYYDLLAQEAAPDDIVPEETSYFSGLEQTLDPRLFRDNKLIPTVRNSILSLALSALNTKFSGAEMWTHAWLAGSGVSYQWAAHRTPADLDCLLGIDYVPFRQMNPAYAGLSDKEIASEINSFLSETLHPQTENYLGTFDLTFYANVKSNIIDIKPYAAYSLTDDKWVVEPKKAGMSRKLEWDIATQRDLEQTRLIAKRYRLNFSAIAAATNPAARRNAETGLLHAVHQGSALYEDIHSGRSHAFGPAGQGYEDFTNYRWQAAKASGVIPALKKLKAAEKLIRGTQVSDTYGVDLPEADVLVRRAALQNIRSNQYGG